MPNWGSVLGKFGTRAAGNVVEQTIGYATGSAASAALAPEVQPFANDAWAAHPSMPVSPQELAAMVVQAIMEEPDAADEARMTGINPDRFHRLVRLSGDPPGPETLLAMHDRNYINEATLTEGLRQSRLKPEWVEPYKRMSRELLTAQTLAEMVVQGVLSHDVATAAAQRVSVEPDDFALLVRVAGSPPGPMESLDMWNRGIMSEDEVDNALMQSRLKPEWVPQFKQLRELVLTPAVAAELVLKQRIPYAQGFAIAHKSGMSETDFRLMADVNGRPIGTVQALQLARRGEFTRDKFTEVVARSDVRTEYADDLWNLRIVLPRMATITRLVTAGEITDARALELVTQLGYEHDIAAAIVNSAKKGKTTHQRDLTASMVDTLYESGLESRQWALDTLRALGYDDDESAMHLMLLDARRLLSAATAELNLIHRMYVGHKYDRDTATNHLDGMEINPEVRNQLLDTWDHERAANVTRLTNAQIGSALKKGIIPQDDAIARWEANGYPHEDAVVLAAIATSSGHPASPTAP